MPEPLPRVLESTALIRFSDCDPFGHLNNTRYLDYMLNARSDQLRDAYNLDVFATGQQLGSSWVVSQSQIAFVLSALPGETVRIRTELIHFTESTLVVEAIMLDEAAARIKAISWVEFTFVSMQTGRRTRHTPEHMHLFGAVHNDIGYAPHGFSARVSERRSALRRERNSTPALA